MYNEILYKTLHSWATCLPVQASLPLCTIHPPLRGGAQVAWFWPSALKSSFLEDCTAFYLGRVYWFLQPFHPPSVLQCGNCPPLYWSHWIPCLCITVIPEIKGGGWFCQSPFFAGGIPSRFADGVNSELSPVPECSEPHVPVWLLFSNAVSKFGKVDNQTRMCGL